MQSSRSSASSSSISRRIRFPSTLKEAYDNLPQLLNSPEFLTSKYANDAFHWVEYFDPEKVASFLEWAEQISIVQTTAYSRYWNMNLLYSAYNRFKDWLFPLEPEQNISASSSQDSFKSIKSDFATENQLDDDLLDLPSEILSPSSRLQGLEIWGESTLNITSESSRPFSFEEKEEYLERLSDKMGKTLAELFKDFPQLRNFNHLGIDEPGRLFWINQIETEYKFSSSDTEKNSIELSLANHFYKDAFIDGTLAYKNIILLDDPTSLLKDLPEYLKTVELSKQKIAFKDCLDYATYHGVNSIDDFLFTEIKYQGLISSETATTVLLRNNYIFLNRTFGAIVTEIFLDLAMLLSPSELTQLETIFKDAYASLNADYTKLLTPEMAARYAKDHSVKIIKILFEGILDHQAHTPKPKKILERILVDLPRYLNLTEKTIQGFPLTHYISAITIAGIAQTDNIIDIIKIRQNMNPGKMRHLRPEDVTTFLKGLDITFIKKFLSFAKTISDSEMESLTSIFLKFVSLQQDTRDAIDPEKLLKFIQDPDVDIISAKPLVDYMEKYDTFDDEKLRAHLSPSVMYEFLVLKQNHINTLITALGYFQDESIPDIIRKCIPIEMLLEIEGDKGNQFFEKLMKILYEHAHREFNGYSDKEVIQNLLTLLKDHRKQFYDLFTIKDKALFRADSMTYQIGLKIITAAANICRDALSSSPKLIKL